MKFNERLKQAMQQLGISQAQVVGMTGIGKSSISQYLSGKNAPSVERQKNIAVSLGLNPEYFEQGIESSVKMMERNSGVIPELRTNNAGKLMRMNHKTVEDGLKQGLFPWGYAIKTSENHHRYFINAKRFAEIEGIDVPPEMVV